MTDKKLLKAVEGKNHDRKPRYSRKKTDLEQWLEDQGAVESVKYDEDTGRPYRSFSIKVGD